MPESMEQVRSQVNVEQRPAKKLKHAKKDALEVNERLGQQSLDVFASVGYSYPTAFIRQISSEATFLPVIFFSGAALVRLGEFEKVRRDTIVKNKQLGYEAAQLVYKNDQEVTIGGVDLKKGDNFMFVSLPSMKLPQGTSSLSVDALNAYSDLQRFAMKDLKEKLKDKDYKTVCINFPESTPSEVKNTLGTHPEAQHQELFQEKGIDIANPQAKAMVLTREEFEDMTLDPREVVTRATEALGDKVVNTYYELSQRAATTEEREQALQMMDARLHQILQNQLESYYNGPERQKTRMYTHSSAYPPAYQGLATEVNRRLTVKSTRNGFHYMVLTSQDGYVETTPLDKALHMEGMPTNDVLAEPSHFKNARIAYTVRRILEETPKKEFVESKALDEASVLAELKNAGLEIDKKGDTFSVRGSKKFSKAFFRLRRLKPVLATLLMQAAIQNAGPLIQNPHEAWEAVQNRPPAIEQTYRADFGAGTRTLDWKVSAYDGMSVAGYYTDATSSSVNKDGDMQINRKVIGPFIPLQSVQTDRVSPHLTLEKRLALSSGGETKIKIPIKDGTVIDSITTSDTSEKKVDYKTFLFSDGTVEVVLPKIRFDRAQAVDMRVNLVPIDTSQVHAAEKPPPLNTSMLRPIALEQLQRAQQVSPSGDEFEKAIAAQVIGAHDYSLDPPGKEKFLNAKTPEEKVNAIAEIAGCDCDTCNIPAMLLTSTDPDPNSFTNLGLGYLHAIYNNPDSRSAQSYLTGDSRHGYGIDEKGQIRDATPSIVALDPTTQQYINAKQTVTEQTDNQTWEQQQTAVYAETARKLDIVNKLKLLGTIGSSIPAYFAARQSGRFLKRVLSKENVQSVTDEVALNIYSDQDLAKVDKFLQWVSWSSGEQKFRQAELPQEVPDKFKTLESLRERVNYEKLDAYVHTPNRFEEKAGISKEEGIAYRTVARYLIT